MNYLILFLPIFIFLFDWQILVNGAIQTDVHLNNTNQSLVSTQSPQLACVLPNQNEHPINLTASCTEAKFLLHFENYSEFSSAIEFDSKTCVGQVELNITLNDCKIQLSKSDIPGGSVIVVNKENHNLISGNRITLTLNDDNLLIQGVSRQFQMKSPCKLTQKHESVQINTSIQNSNPNCKALISLDSSAKFYDKLSFWQVVQNNLTFFIVSALIIILCILLLILMLCLWYLNSLPGTRLVSPRTGKYKPKSIEESFPNAYPVHFKPNEEPITRSSQTIEIHQPMPAVTIEKFEPTDQQIKL